MFSPAYLIHILKSFGVHIFFGVVVVFSFNFALPEKDKKEPEVNPIDAVVIDQVMLEQQVKQIQKKKADAKAAEEKRVRDLERRADRAKQDLNKLNKQKSQSEKDAAAAKKRAAQEKKKAAAEKAKAEKAKKDRLKKEKEAKAAAKAEEKAKLENAQYLLKRLLQTRFGEPLPDWVEQRLAEAEYKQLEDWSVLILTAESLETVLQPSI